MYESFYNLSGKPFQLSPDPDFYYESRVHKRAYAYLEYGLYQGEGFIVITGEVGAGKTTIVRNLLTHLDASKVVAAHLVSTMLDADDLVRAVCGAFGLHTKGADKASLLSELEQFLRGVAQERKRALLIVDEAQNLTPRAIEELRMLSNFQSGERALLQSFLVGQPELRRVMQNPRMQQLRQRVIASYHLGPLDRAETEAYIEHRLRRVGWKGDPKIDVEGYDAIFAFTAGIPRRINMIANRLMLAGFLGNTHTLTAKDVEIVAGEIKEELSAAGKPGFGLNGSGGAATAANGPMPGEDEESPLEGANAVNISLSAADGTPLSPEELQARVLRLERTLAVMLPLMRRMVSVLEPLGAQPTHIADAPVEKHQTQ